MTEKEMKSSHISLEDWQEVYADADPRTMTAEQLVKLGEAACEELGLNPIDLYVSASRTSLGSYGGVTVWAKIAVPKKHRWSKDSHKNVPFLVVSKAEAEARNGSLPEGSVELRLAKVLW